ncbi:MAG TPA: DUF222 domain-containing protein [Microlunatus sp.]
MLSERTMNRVLTNGLRLSPGEAARRVRAAEHLADRTSMTGEPLTPIRPHLATAQRDGLVTPEQVTLIDTALRKVKHCDPAAVEAGEILLVQHACDRLVRRRRHQHREPDPGLLYHHHQFAQRGWQCVINHDGLPVWIPPKWIDRHQRPILNARITINNWDPQDPLNFDQPLAGTANPPDPPGQHP